MLGLMAAMYFFYQLDRNAVLVTQEMFKDEFGLSDTQVGLTTGLLYGAAYAIVGLPLGRAIDFLNRSKLLAVLVAIWSGMTLLCGFATQFWQMAAARVLVGASESGGSPTALSLLSDLYPPQRRASVSSIFFAGAGLGGIVSFLLGGFIAAHYGWRAVFLLYGLPGLVLAALIWLTVSEPARTVAIDRANRLSFVATAKTLLSDPALLGIYTASVVWTMSLAGVGNWMMPYFLRVHHLSPGVAGLTIALSFGVLSTIGGMSFGAICDRAERRRTGGMLRLLGLAAVLSAVAAIGIAAATVPTMAIAIYAIWGLTALTYSGIANAAIARLAPEQSRGLAFSLFAVLCNLIGAGLGPVMAGAISDYYAPTLGPASIRPAIAIMGALQFVSAAAIFFALGFWKKRVAPLATAS